MKPFSELPGLERLMEVCRRLELGLETAPPSRSPPEAGALMEGLPFDPMLAAFYARFAYAVFAMDVTGIIMEPLSDEDRQLEEQNAWWSRGYRQRLALPTLIFAGEPHMAYHYAVVPSLADEQGLQPVVRVDVYEEPYALPVASCVDRFFETYSRYLEALVALPQGREEGGALLTFPWDVPDLIARDASLVEGIRTGRFDPFMPGAEEQTWARRVVASAGTGC
jgi:hypothetical protein